MPVDQKSDQYFFEQAAKIAQKSSCLKRHCGSLVVARGRVIGKGYNSPPRDDISLRRCHLYINKHSKRPTDKTCCIHAEQRALVDAIKNSPQAVKGSTVYFASIDKDDQLEFAGKPYCTHCSKMALDLGVAKFGLWHSKGAVLYDTVYYNELSYNYNRKR